MKRRSLLASTALVAPLALLGACGASTTSTLTADLNTGILDAGLIATALGTVEPDIKLDNPALISASQDAEFLSGLAALRQADANLVALGANPIPSSAMTPLQQVVTAFNGLIAVVNAVLPPAAVVSSTLEPVLVIFQSATLLIQDVIEPLIAQLAAAQPTASVRMVAARLTVASRFQPSPSMTLDQARSALRIAAGRRK